jgi:hypothetical protein
VISVPPTPTVITTPTSVQGVSLGEMVTAKGIDENGAPINVIAIHFRSHMEAHHRPKQK